MLDRNIAGFLLACCLIARAEADQILQIHAPSLTTYKADASAVQGVRPLSIQRGVGIDGTLRSGPAMRWAIAGNPFEGRAGGEWFGNIALASGTYEWMDVDILLPAEVPWMIGRTYNNRQMDGSSAHIDSNGYQGRNWFQVSQPEIVFHDDDSNPLTKGANDLLYIVYGADRYIEFKRVEADSDAFRGVNGAAGIIEFEEGDSLSDEPDLFVFHDQNGMRTYFFGENTPDDRANWQIWKIMDPADNTAYVGHPTDPVEAAEVGYNADGMIVLAFDSWGPLGRRFTYEYDEIDGDTRLVEVTAEYRTSGVWGDPTFNYLAAKVEYSYYEDEEDHGTSGDLKLVTITVPMSEAGAHSYGATVEVPLSKYYRYWTGEYNSSTNEGHPHAIKMIVGFEGARKYDILHDLNDRKFNQSYYFANEIDLKPYSEAYFTYDAERRIATTFLNGECGCGGSVNGEHFFTYEANDDFSGTSGYDTAWSSRTIIEPPGDLAWTTQYFDETGQALSSISMSDNPAGGSVDTWVTRRVRDAYGMLAQVHTPANATGYNHNDGTDPDGDITSSASVGLVHYLERNDGSGVSELRGFLLGLREKAGATDLSTTSTYLSSRLLEVRKRTMPTGVDLARPVISATRAYHTAGTNAGTTANFDEISYDVTYWDETTQANLLYIVPKLVETILPEVSAATNGSGTSESRRAYLRKDGTQAFSESARGIMTYFEMEDSLVTRVVTDVQTDGAFPTGDDPEDDFDMVESGDGFQHEVVYRYDYQGRIWGVVSPATESTIESVTTNTRTAFYMYTALKDRQFVTYSGAWSEGHFEPTIPSGKFYGTADILLTNQASQQPGGAGGFPNGGLVGGVATGPSGAGSSSSGGGSGGGGAGGPGGFGFGARRPGGPAAGGPGGGVGGTVTGCFSMPRVAIKVCGSQWIDDNTGGGGGGGDGGFAPPDEFDDLLAALAMGIGSGGEGGAFTIVGSATVSTYDVTGTRLLSRDVYFDIPGGPDYLPGIEGEHFDRWSFDYDDVGRRVRTEHPSGTVERVEYDLFGRQTARFIGTDDSVSTGNMVKVEEFEYDGGNDGGNGYLTTQVSYVVDGTTDSRTTEFFHDHRGRVTYVKPPLPPFSVSAYDNLGRTIASASFSSSSGLSASTDPLTTTSNRTDLSRVYYDARGQVWKSAQHRINQSNGADIDSLDSLSWFDPDGRVIKTDAQQLTKTRYDRLGRVQQQFVLATTDDAANVYGDVYDATHGWADLDGDKVLEESQYGYDGFTSVPLVTASIMRLHDDTTTTGPLELTFDGGDEDPLSYTAADLEGRLQLSAFWHDRYDRVITKAVIGTADPDPMDAVIYARSGEPQPTSPNADMLVTTVSYTASYSGLPINMGVVVESRDESGILSRNIYDYQRRTLATIANYKDGTTPGGVGDDDFYTRYEYKDQLMTRMWVDLDGDGAIDTDDQVTDYIYGTTKGAVPGSAIASGHLLRAARYPDSTNTGEDYTDIDSDDSDVESFAYNAQGETVFRKDQAGNVITTEYDLVGREIHRRVSTLITPDFDGSVRRISSSYLPRGMVDKVTQHDAATGGNVVDDLRFTYDDWGNVHEFIQDVDSDLDASPSGRASFKVAHTYAKSTSGRNTIIRSRTDLPGDTKVFNQYLSSGGKLDAAAARVSRVEVSVGIGFPEPVPIVPVAGYEYLGSSILVGTDLFEPDVRWQMWEHGSDYPDLDHFNRVVKSRWTSYKATPIDFYNTEITYTNNTGQTTDIHAIKDHVHTSAGDGLFDVRYTMDGMHRLIRAQEGHWNGSTLSAPTRDERWALSYTGNWDTFKRDLNGDGVLTGTNELDEVRTHNKVNELTGRDLDGGGNEFEPVYDVVGNLIDDEETYKYVYDAFGRLRKVFDQSDELVAEHRYNGLGYRIGWHYNANADHVVDANDPWFYFCYDDSWRQVATFRGTDATPKEVFVHHNAGLSGFGGSSYIDAVIFRDRDASTSWWEDAADGLREERIYYVQNWRADVSALLTDTGSLIQWVKYSAYGVPFMIPSGDIDSDGDFDLTDVGGLGGGTFTDRARQDVNLDGVSDFDDVLDALALHGSGTFGWGTMSAPQTANRRGYAGYEYDPVPEAQGRHLYHVRHRVYDADSGRWTRRDPLGYVDGASLYNYTLNSPLQYLDPYGMLRVVPKPVLAPPVRVPMRPMPYVAPQVYLCIAVACGAYCIGESVSDDIFPPVNPVIPQPIKRQDNPTLAPRKNPNNPRDPNNPCHKQRLAQDAACGSRGPPPVQAPDQGMPKGMVPGSKGFCRALKRNTDNAHTCHRAMELLQMCMTEHYGPKDQSRYNHQRAIERKRTEIQGLHDAWYTNGCDRHKDL